MKFTPLLKESAADPSALSQEYAEAEDFAPAKLGAAHFFFKVGRKVYYLFSCSYANIVLSYQT